MIRTPRILRAAILMWRRDQSLPLHIETGLMALGYDVPALEARYRA